MTRFILGEQRGTTASSICIRGEVIPMKPSYLVLMLILIAIPLPALALEVRSGSDVRIDQATDDDVIATGGMIAVDAPVGSLIAAGGQVTVNAPVKGDVIAAGGQITINSDVGGKVVAAGGTITVNGKVGTNAVLTGGTIALGSSSSVGRDALVSGGSVTAAGTVAGKLSVRANTFEDRGSEGTLEVELREPSPLGGIFLSVFSILFTIGLLVLGLILIRMAPGPYRAVEAEISRSPVVRGALGFGILIAGFILLILLAITLVGLPLAILLGLLMLAGILLSTLFVSSALGRWIAGLLKRPVSDYLTFIIGFVVLNLLYRIPVAGTILLAIAVCLGFGALLSTAWGHRAGILGVSQTPG
jgi:hypothetical protein